ncbi:WecB/TagA/CpsF family glycosyltransferase [Actimicrobium sp. CCI2.3]|uniref:WecB/TagA/CpsF family glycosyltransferase n=1 Tax=Actimicrobium sp. CCI2.3 TaxID=3048616 RepID=UPI002AB5DA55|nr:WecB/TagA/CpsF family glycosyltransferase [Actimicrobium sp. CCI2.3]MDY7576654.1 WecB/TagA/CpsF family glycosyltransferase [Actimicrobium sp. CCI2.3]MEB0021255.1 WecB/TagA/CpsF family glycosyltransferase [Actimicrobium sp. CCI2.3]
MDKEKFILISQFPVLDTNRVNLAERLLSNIYHQKKSVLLFANTNFIVTCRFILEYTKDPSVLIVSDGVGMDIAARLLHGTSFEENLNGTDFTPFLFQSGTRPLRVFLLGGKPDVIQSAGKFVEEKLGQVIVGWCDGYGGLRDAKDIEGSINDANPDVVLVALGNPLQEKWIIEHRDKINASLLIGVGALFDFWSGDKARAPRMVQRLRLEWLYRLFLEPRRLLRRYTIDILVFLRQCYRYR